MVSLRETRFRFSFSASTASRKSISPKLGETGASVTSSREEFCREASVSTPSGPEGAGETQSQPGGLLARPVKYLAVALAALALTCLLALTAARHPGDSTNLLRTASIQARLDALGRDLAALSLRDWLVGRGLFLAAPTPSVFDRDHEQLFTAPGGLTNRPPLSTSASATLAASEFARDPLYKTTRAFPDNIFVLLISFIGLPATLALLAVAFATSLKSISPKLGETGASVTSNREEFSRERFHAIDIYVDRSLPIHSSLFTLHSSLPYYLLALLVVAQFQQAVFQPFVFLLTGLLLLTSSLAEN